MEEEEVEYDEEADLDYINYNNKEKLDIEKEYNNF